jgi:hypothetical protein
LRRRGLRLEWATNGWNAMEVVVTISLGVQAGSLALIAFGLDSIVEIFASTVVIRNLGDERRDPGDRRVHRSLRLIAVAFWVLAAFLVLISLRGCCAAIGLRAHPSVSPIWPSRLLPCSDSPDSSTSPPTNSAVSRSRPRPP